VYILDTDHLSIQERDTIEAFNLGLRLAQVPSRDVVTSIITYEEQMRGWLAYVARASSQDQQVEAYKRLRLHVERYRRIPLVDYDGRAATEFDRLRAARVRVKAADLKIAAIALANDATLLTRNAADFERVPGLRFEDWTG